MGYSTYIIFIYDSGFHSCYRLAWASDIASNHHHVWLTGTDQMLRQNVSICGIFIWKLPITTRFLPLPVNPLLISLEHMILIKSVSSFFVLPNSICPCIYFLLQEINARRETRHVLLRADGSPQNWLFHKSRV